MAIEKYGAVPDGELIKTSSVACDEFEPKPGTTTTRGQESCVRCAQQDNPTGTRSPLCPHNDGRRPSNSGAGWLPKK